MCRIYSLFLVLAVLLSSVFSTVLAEKNNFSFPFDKILHILIVADPQDIDTPQPAMLSLLNSSLDAADPNLVVFLGDMIHGRDLRGEERVKKAIDAVVSPVVERGIPFALVFGNHDEECGISKEEQLKIYQSYPGCLAVDGEDLPGCGNYYIVVENPVQPESPIVLWFMDSGSYAEEGKGTYGYVTEEQNEWMLSAYEELCGKYASPVSYVFQHIPVPQVYNMIKEVPFGTSGSVTCYGPSFGKWYVINEEYIWEGHLGEGPCSSEYDSGEFDTWKKMNVKAAFFGHDHLNDYCGTYEGIDMVTTSGVGFYLYGRGDEHGTRLVTLNAENPAGYETKMLYYKDLVSEPLPGLFVSSLGVMLRKYVFIGMTTIIVLIIFIIWLIRHVRRRRKQKRLKRMYT